MKASYTGVNKHTALILKYYYFLQVKTKVDGTMQNLCRGIFDLLVCFLTQYAIVVFVEMSAKMRSLDREVRGLRMEKEDIERVSVDFICFVLFFPNQNSVFEQSTICLFFVFTVTLTVSILSDVFWKIAHIRRRGTLIVLS